MKNFILVGILIFTFVLQAQDKDLTEVKEEVNEYLDQRIEKVQNAKDCVLSAQSISEVEECRSLLEDGFDDYKKRVKENRNG